MGVVDTSAMESGGMVEEQQEGQGTSEQGVQSGNTIEHEGAEGGYTMQYEIKKTAIRKGIQSKCSVEHMAYLGRGHCDSQFCVPNTVRYRC